jgi:predicted MFS family arabinose efflux permease
MRSERSIIFLVGAVQFVNILDFMMVMPLGPDFARGLGIPTSVLGYIGGSYTLAAAVAGFAGSFFLDRFDRRKALAVAMTGLVIGTLAGGLAVGLRSLMAARVIAGTFGGPATSIALAIIADVIPQERRGKAMGAVMGAFSVASVVGVPLSLRLSLYGGWSLPFFVVGGMGLVLVALAISMLPPLRIHLQVVRRPRSSWRALGELLSRRIVLLSYTMTATVMMAGFILIPNLSAYIQYNLGFAREYIDVLYMAGGAASFFTMRLAGWTVDRYGSFRAAAGACMAVVVLAYFWFLHFVPGTPIVLFFVGYMIANSFRNVAHSTLTSKVPGPLERARFMSIQSTVQHLASSAGAFLSARMLVELPDHRLAGMDVVAVVSMTLTALLPGLFWVVEGRVRLATLPRPA